MKSEYLPKTAYKSLLRRMQNDNALAMRVMLHTGLRIDDVLNLKVENLVDNKVFFIAKKTGKSGYCTIPRSIADQLRKNANKVWLFPSPYKGGKKHKTRQAIFTDLKKSISCSDIKKHISPHSTRKTFAVELRRKKGVEEVKKALQHDDIGTTLIYALSDYDEQKNDIDYEFLSGLIAEKIYKLLFPEIKKMLTNNLHSSPEHVPPIVSGAEGVK